MDTCFTEPVKLPHIDVTQQYGYYTVTVDGKFHANCDSMREVREELEDISNAD